LDGTWLELDDFTIEDELLEPEQVPKGVWQPALQWFFVLPHQLYCEQPM
jgi:hypothetical protein